MKLFSKGKGDAAGPAAQAPSFQPIDRVRLLGYLDQLVNGSQSGVLELREPRGAWTYAFQGGALTHASGGRVRGARQAFDLLWEFQSGEFQFTPGSNPALAGNLYIDKARLLELLRRSQAALQGPASPYIAPDQQRPVAPAPPRFSPPQAGQMPPQWQPAGGQPPIPGQAQQWPAGNQPGYPQPGYPQQSFPQPGYPQPGYPQPGYPQPGYPQPGYAQSPGPAQYPQPYPQPAPMGQPAPGPAPQAAPVPMQQAAPAPIPQAAPAPPPAPSRQAVPPSFSVPPMAIPKRKEPAPAYQPPIAPAAAVPQREVAKPAPPAPPKDDLQALRASLVAQAPEVPARPAAPNWGVRTPEGTVVPPAVAGKAVKKQKAGKGRSKLRAAIDVKLITFLLWACERKYSPDDHWTLKDAFEVSTMELRDQFIGAFSQSFKPGPRATTSDDDVDQMAAGRMRGRARKR